MRTNARFASDDFGSGAQRNPAAVDTASIMLIFSE